MQQVIESLNTAMLDDLDIKDLILKLPKPLRPYLQVAPSMWMYDDPLYGQIKAMPTLYTTGKIVWASLVQANRNLFEPEWISCAGEVVFDPSGEMQPVQLVEAAEQLFSLKGTTPDFLDQKNYAAHLTNEFTRVFNYPFPQSLAALPLKMSSMWFEYRHLPGGLLAMKVFPIIVSEQNPNYIMFLPSYFWPNNFFKDKWLDLAAHSNGGGLYDVEKDVLNKIINNEYLEEILLRPQLAQIFEKQTPLIQEPTTKQASKIKFSWFFMLFSVAILMGLFFLFI
ncbi:hypothetical protein NDN11_11215 [Acinetobacter sp. C26M]|uniref:hypothetical protein n=1 Tax=unclassified Acinetobacter TaxID=196816 RepID=UPI0020368F5F|nr:MULTISPECIES: hypothetical protein [unclassified Acinetobacter]USA45292.1 hypothetical protein NDN11_11215 [Acinetobacter sp. C26M]USA48794.1 hypothetical protein NDN12_11215 [Acinetobacter sp. C26G]